MPSAGLPWRWSGPLTGPAVRPAPLTQRDSTTLVPGIW